MNMSATLNAIAAGQELSTDDMRAVMSTIMGGEATPAQIGAFLMGLRTKGETAGEIASAVAIMREKMIPVDAPDDAMDIVGTGGDGSGTYNISTATAFIAAAAGVPIAKHGNRALSSNSGSAEALKVLGVELDLPAEGIARCIREAGIGFMFAPNHHPAMRFVGPVRAEMGIRTIFNLLGPQSNPAGVKRFLLGVFAPEWVRPVADALLENGATSAWVVHGHSGLDEISTTGPTQVAAVEDGAVREFEIAPADIGIEIADLSDLKGGTPEENAAALRAILDGERNAYRDIVIFNAAAALLIAGKVNSLSEGAALAADLIDTGAARLTLERLVSTSQDAAQ
ncbi:anthranilate phosphoribosyltransferase [Cucumibacter marinus]|uniref:anthranilate phosphoribosyltransferase n=1 Tax=Cucumibacter marinus TaxID=1121252 RepID=UPI0004076933|nr:anthranilate phosphoribosyltransferase [Cucumibacter marinus]